MTSKSASKSGLPTKKRARFDPGLIDRKWYASQTPGARVHTAGGDDEEATAASFFLQLLGSGSTPASADAMARRIMSSLCTGERASTHRVSNSIMNHREMAATILLGAPRPSSAPAGAQPIGPDRDVDTIMEALSVRAPDVFMSVVRECASEWSEGGGISAAARTFIDHFAPLCPWAARVYSESVSGVDGGEDAPVPMKIISEISISLYWVLLWARIYVSAKPPSWDGIGANDIRQSLSAMMRATEFAGAHISYVGAYSSRRSPWVLAIQESELRFSSDRTVFVDPESAARIGYSDSERVDTMISEASIAPWTAKQHEIIADLWTAYAWAHAMGQTIPKPAGMLDSEYMFTSWYFIPWHDIGTQRFFYLMSFMGMRLGVRQRPLIVHLGGMNYAVVSSKYRAVFIDRGFVFALMEWALCIQSEHFSKLETGARMDTDTVRSIVSM